MTNDYLKHAQDLHQTIRRAMLEDWDPIGIAHLPEAQDEYDSYISTIHKMLTSRRPRHEIFDYLWWLETDHMGLIGDRQATEQFAERLAQIVADGSSSSEQSQVD
jgi:hypothetical protein